MFHGSSADYIRHLAHLLLIGGLGSLGLSWQSDGYVLLLASLLAGALVVRF